MKNVFFIVTFLTLTLGFSQNAKTSKKEVLTSYIEAYNNQDFNAVFNLYSENEQQELGMKRIEVYSKRLFNTYGKISFSKKAEIKNSYTYYEVLSSKKSNKLHLALKINSKNELEDVSFNKIK